jgi:CheY-like chemotaxis protein
MPPFPLKILVVDDNLPSGEMMSLALRGMGHTVSSAASGEDAIKHVAVAPPDVVLMDIRMPGVDGYAAARRIKTLLPHVVVLAMSGHMSYIEARNARAAGCEAQFEKPIDPAQLREFLARLYAPEAQG